MIREKNAIGMLASSLAAPVAALLLSLFHAPAAQAANGQCKWEGGAGKGTYPYCEAEDCIGNGGTAQCTKGIAAASSASSEPYLGPEKWVYSACDEQNPHAMHWANWCTSAGGDWVGSTLSCVDLPAAFFAGSGSVASDEGSLVSAADEFSDGGGKVLKSDTGWHATFSSNLCLPGNDVSALGILTKTSRRRRYENVAGTDGITISFYQNRAAKCPPGYKTRTAVGTGSECYIPGTCCIKLPNNVEPYTGTKLEDELDYGAPGAPELRRQYRSSGYYRPRNITSTAPDPETAGAGEFWRTNYDRRLYTVTGNAEVSAFQSRPDGAARAFASNGKEIGTIDGGAAALAVVSGVGWDLTLPNHDVERYDTTGKLISITTRAGRTTTLTYDSCDLLSTVTNDFGQALTFTNDCGAKRATAVTLPDSSQILYAYDDWGRPTTVTYPDSTTRTYVYGDVRNPWLLTAIQDENNQTYATYVYDASGRVSSTEYAGRAEYYTLTYGTNATTVVDPLGASTVHGFSSSGGAFRRASQSIACRDCGKVSGRTYDAKGNPATETDFNGILTQFQFDLVRNLQTSRTEAHGTARARTTTTAWHSTFRIPTQIDQPGRRTAFTHDADGNVLTRTITDLATSATRVWTYTYDSYGRVLTEDGPRSGASDTTTYAYYTCGSGNECGQIHTITNALSQVTTYNSYNAHAQPLSITDSNGVTTTLTYDQRQRLTSRTTAGEVTAFEYWPTGLLKKSTLPDDSFILYTYDGAHRLTRVQDSAGNYTRYVLDNAGNRVEEYSHDTSGALAFKRKQVFNSLGRLWKQLGAAGSAAVTTTFAYDTDGNQTGINAPLGRNTVNQYDELDRLKQITDPASGVTQFGYDALDNLTSVTDPRGKVTGYQYNGFGESTQVTSPDTGVTVNTYDSAGNLGTTTDARGKVGTHTYDALNRLTSLAYPDQTTTFTYDSGTNGVGRLTGASDPNHSLAWVYDGLGRVTSKTQVVSAVSKAVGYSYADGQLQSVTLPSGRVVSYGYSNNQITSVSVDGAVVLDAVVYEPFGPVSGWTWGNGTTTTRTFDEDGKTTGIASAGSTTYGYDNAFRVTGITDQDNSARSWSYGYDSVDRLTSASRTGLSQTWTYDANGNRTAQGGTSSSTYSVSSTSNRLSSITGALARTYSYANSGQVTGYAGLTFTYNDAGRLTGVSGGATASYVLNALGQRVKKVTGGVTTYFIYDESGHLVGEYDGAGALIQEIVWLGDTPVATLRDCSCGDAIFYIHTDHLNTPRRITKRSTTDIVWRWDSDPFGTTAANEDPDGDSTTFAFNLRLPGQYYDAETGLHYNYFRDYDSGAGRYNESDPIGLGGGINTYTYVGSNPIMLVDPLGLQARDAHVPTAAEIQEMQERSCARQAFLRNFSDMETANVIGADRYFHCKANCEAARCGKYGIEEACVVSNVREATDTYAKYPFKRLLRLPRSPTHQQAVQDAQQDQVANVHGRTHGVQQPNQPCSTVCSPFRPNGLGPQY